MLLSSRERNENIHRKAKHTVNYDFCCTFIRLLRTGREGRGREVSSVPGSPSSWQGKKQPK